MTMLEQVEKDLDRRKVLEHDLRRMKEELWNAVDALESCEFRLQRMCAILKRYTPENADK